jgi:1-acyl-sn-glycerol-3-phosphate acyltransferase
MRSVGAYAFWIFLGLSALIIGVIASPAMLLGRNAARAVVKFWIRMVLGALRLLAGVTHRIEGAEHLPTTGAVVAANHQSQWETLLLYLILPNPVFILKKELTRIPVYGWWASFLGNIAVDRGGGPKALRAMREAAVKKIEDGCQVIIFPESTRVKPGERRPFQPGVAGVYAAAGAPCAPAAHDSGRYWRNPGPKKTPGEILLKILPPIPPGLDRRAFLARLEREINAARPDLAAEQSDV